MFPLKSLALKELSKGYVMIQWCAVYVFYHSYAFESNYKITHCCTTLLRQTANGIMVVVDALVPNKQQAIDNHHTDSTVTTVSHQIYFIAYI